MDIAKTGRRRSLVVDKRFQFKATIIGIVYILAAAFCLSLPVFHLMRLMGLLLATSTGEMASVYRSQQTFTVVALVGFLIGLIALWIIFTLWRTQRIAGPLVKITRYIHEYAAGNFSGRIQLRSDDDMKALADSLNDMADSLEHREQAIREQVQAKFDERIADARREMSGPGNGADALERLAADVAQAFRENSSSTPGGDHERESEDLVYTESP